MITLAAPNGMLALRLHPSLYEGLRRDTSFDSLNANGAVKLLEWADACDNPKGQRAALARSVASLITVCGTLQTRVDAQPPTGFWEAVGR